VAGAPATSDRRVAGPGSDAVLPGAAGDLRAHCGGTGNTRAAI